MEQALSKGTVIARYFHIQFWQHSIHVYVYRYMYQCTVSLPPPPPPPPPPLPRPIAFYVFVLVSPPEQRNLKTIAIQYCYILLISRYRRSAKDHFAAALPALHGSTGFKQVGVLNQAVTLYRVFPNSIQIKSASTAVSSIAI